MIEEQTDPVQRLRDELSWVRADWLHVCGRNERLELEVQELRDEVARLRRICRQGEGAIRRGVRYPLGELARVIEQLAEAGKEIGQ